MPFQNTLNRNCSFKTSLVIYEDVFALSVLKSQISRRDKYILTWFQDIFKLKDVATNVAYGPPFKRSKEVITSYLKGIAVQLLFRPNTTGIST